MEFSSLRTSLTKRLRPRPAGAPPLVEHGLPILGPPAAYGRDPLGFLQQCQRRYGNVFTLDFLAYRATYLVGEEEQRLFLRAKDDVLDLRSAISQFSTSVLGGGLFDMPKPEQERAYFLIRKGLMKEGSAPTYFTEARSEAEATFERWADAGEIDLFAAASRLVTSINLRCFLGADAAARYGHRFAEAYYDVERYGGAAAGLEKEHRHAVRRGPRARARPS